MRVGVHFVGGALERLRKVREVLAQEIVGLARGLLGELSGASAVGSRAAAGMGVRHGVRAPNQ
jgi:hypothetical protein